MYHEVTKLRDFYYRSALGRSVQSRLQEACRNIWPDVQDEILIGYGFASPLLRPFLKEASHVVNLMPADQGVMAWPPGGRNMSALCLESAWPLGASSADKLIALHAVESANNVSALLNEFWRVLAPEGRAIIIFANRMGIWSNNENTPFGQGRPFAVTQFEALLSQHQFEIIRREGALYGSPWRSALGLNISNRMEKLGGRFRGRILAGVWLLEVAKSSPGKAIRVQKREPIFATPELRPAGALRKDRF